MSGERTLGIRFLIIKLAFIIQLFIFALSVSSDGLKVEKVNNHHTPWKTIRNDKIKFFLVFLAANFEHNVKLSN